MVNTKFDPAAHLTKQGWKGKGTGMLDLTQYSLRSQLIHVIPALKHGHATRPLPVVQKKTLSGIGKDRDEAVPFWDQYLPL